MKRGYALICIVLLSMICLPSFGAYAEDTKAENSRNRAVFAKYDKMSNQLNGWDICNPFLDTSKETPTEYNIFLNDGSEEYSSEAYLTLDEINSGLFTMNFDFTLDSYMDDTSFRLLDHDMSLVFGIITEGDAIYLETANGSREYLCTYEPNKKFLVKTVFDADDGIIKTIWINGEMYRMNKSFGKNGVISGFDIRTSESARGTLTNTKFYLERGYIINESFFNPEMTVTSDWGKTSETLYINKKNISGKEDMNIVLAPKDEDVSAQKTFDSVAGELTFDINIMQTQANGICNILMYGENKKVIELYIRNGILFVGGTNERLGNIKENLYYHLRLEINTETKQYDVWINNNLIRENIDFLDDANSLNFLRILAQKNCSPVHVDDILLSYKTVYAEDYPVIDNVPEKKNDAPFIMMQFCPLWVQGQHRGWDYIKQASNIRKPVMGYFDGCSSEYADWTVKYLKEHGVDFMAICTYPAAPKDFDGKMDPLTDSSLRLSEFINAFLTSRYRNEIKFSVFMEMYGIDAGKEYYDYFFNILLPYYIENYFKSDSYQKLDGRPVLGVYSPENLYNVLDTGKSSDGSDRNERIRNGIEKIRKMCIDAGVGNPYLVIQHTYQAGIEADDADYGFDAVTAYGYDNKENFAPQKATLDYACSAFSVRDMDFIPALMPMRDDSAWRPNVGYRYTGEQFQSMIEWVSSLFKDKRMNGQENKIINMCTWDEFGEGHILCPTEGNGFMYLDAIRQAVTVGSGHSDSVPDDSQKKRITHMYSDSRRLIRVDNENNEMPRRVYYGSVENDIPQTIPSDVKMSIDFRQSDNVSRIKMQKGIKSITACNEGVSILGQSSSTDLINNTPQIKIYLKEKLDVYDVTYLKIRMKNNPTSGGGFIGWTSDFFGTETTGRQVFMNSYGGEAFCDYYVPVKTNPAWTGKVDSLTIKLGYIRDYDTPFIIESIEFLRDKSVSKADKFTADGHTVALKDELIFDGDRAMVPLNEIGYIAGAQEMYTYQSQKRWLIKYNNAVSELSIDSDKAIVNGKTIQLTEAPYTKSSDINSAVYIPIQLMREIFSDKVFVLKPDEHQIVMSDRDKAEPISPDNVLHYMRSIVVEGHIGKLYAGEAVTIVLMKKDSELNGILTGDILYLNETKVDDEGRYSHTFRVSDNIDVSDCKICVRIGKDEITDSAVKTIIKTDDIIDVTSCIEYDGKTASLKVNISNPMEAGWDFSDFRGILAFYSKEGILRGVKVGDKNSMNISEDVPNGTDKIKGFVFRNLENIIPLAIAQEQTIKGKNE